MTKLSQAKSNIQGSFAQRRADVLSELVRIFSLGKKPAALVEAAVTLVADATGGKSVFVYFWDPDSEHLILRTMTDSDLGYSRTAIQMRLGEGITGWSALHRKSVLINENFQDDPRFFKIDDVDEDDFSSVLVTPIYDDENLYGVFSMYSGQPDAFGPDEVAIAEEVGLLLASGLKRAETVRELELQSATARFLIDLPSVAGTSFASAARECARRILTLLEADVCIINYVGWLSMATEPIAVAERNNSSTHPKIWLSHSRQQAEEVEKRYQNAGCDQISASLGYGISRGILTCFRARKFDREEIHRLNMLATQVGMLIENIGFAPNLAAQTMSLLASDREDQMVESLKYLGWKGNAFIPVLAQVKRIGGDVETFGRLVQESALDKLGSETILVHSGTLLVLLVPLDASKHEKNTRNKITEWIQNLEARLSISADVGIGESTILTNSIRNSLLQTRLALAWASFSSDKQALQVVDFDSIKDVRNLPLLVYELTEEVQSCMNLLKPLKQYDREHDTRLIETVEGLALQGGTVASAAEKLFVHRNTLRQRLERISAIIDVDWSHESRWPQLLLAARLLKQENNFNGRNSAE